MFFYIGTVEKTCEDMDRYQLKCTYVFRDLRCGAVGGLTERYTDSAEECSGRGWREAPLPRQIEEKGQQEYYKTGNGAQNCSRFHRY